MKGHTPQGNIFSPFPTTAQSFIMLRFGGRKSLRSFIKYLLPKIERRSRSSYRSSPLVAVGLTASGAAKCMLFEIELAAHHAFAAGAASRADFLRQFGESHPTRWIFGGPWTPQIDAIVTIAGTNHAEVSEELHELSGRLTSLDAEAVHIEQGGDLPPPFNQREHFGFRDGISQPRIRGLDCQCMRGECGCVTIGEFAIGYPRESVNMVQFPAIPAGPWGYGGTFGILTRFNQDVGLWRRQTAAIAQTLTEQRPTAPISPNHIAELLIGRSQSGDRLDPTSDLQYGKLRPHLASQVDRLDLGVQRFAHIRKMAPDDRSVGSRNWYRIIRRGVPFGPILDDEESADQPRPRGLLFNSFVGRIESQYEQVLHGWANDHNFPDPNSGPDPVIGNSRYPIRWRLPDRRIVETDFHGCVTVAGSVYLFYPTLGALNHLVASDELG